MNILVSGIAGDIGFGVGRILKNWGWHGQLFGIDIHAEHPGNFIFDQCQVAPRASEENYFDWLFDFIRKNNIELFIPTSEAEISLLNKNKTENTLGSKILISNSNTINNSLDKYKCMNFLGNSDLRVPKHGIVGITTPQEFPIIVKPRSGQGSKGIVKINNAIDFLNDAAPGFVWQELLTPDDQEYTCPVYQSKNRELKILLIKRTLTGGLTGRGEIVNNPEIEHYVYKIAKLLDVDGSVNIQLRLTKDGPCLFEVNPRLSSTLVFRDKMGFCDLRWWVQDCLGAKNTPEIPSYTPPKAGTRFYRGAQEYISQIDKQYNADQK